MGIFYRDIGSVYNIVLRHKFNFINWEIKRYDSISDKSIGFLIHDNEEKIICRIPENSSFCSFGKNFKLNTYCIIADKFTDWIYNDISHHMENAILDKKYTHSIPNIPNNYPLKNDDKISYIKYENGIYLQTMIH